MKPYRAESMGSTVFIKSSMPFVTKGVIPPGIHHPNAWVSKFGKLTMKSRDYYPAVRVYT